MSLRPVTLLATLGALTAGAGCNVPSYDELAGIPVAAAELDGTLLGGGMFAGGGGGNGSLEVLDTSGALHQFDVRLSAGSMGMMMQLGEGTTFDDVPIAVSDGTVVDELFAVYECESLSLLMGAGVSIRQCDANKASFEVTSVAVGLMSMFAGKEWIALDWDDPGSTPGPDAPDVPAAAQE